MHQHHHAGDDVCRHHLALLPPLQTAVHHRRPRAHDDALRRCFPVRRHGSAACLVQDRPSVRILRLIKQHEPSAMEEWLYFKGVIDWVQALFPKYRKEMKGLEWGAIYNEFSGEKYDPAALEREIV